MDAINSSQPDNGTGQVANETLPEKVPSGLGSSTQYSYHLTVDTHAGALRNAPSDAAPRIPDGQLQEELGRSQHFALRTLPGMLNGLALELFMLIVFHSLDSIG